MAEPLPPNSPNPSATWKARLADFVALARAVDQDPAVIDLVYAARDTTLVARGFAATARAAQTTDDAVLATVRTAQVRATIDAVVRGNRSVDGPSPAVEAAARAVGDAVGALAVRERIDPDTYDLMTYPVRVALGPLHPDDPPTAGAGFDAVQVTGDFLPEGSVVRAWHTGVTWNGFAEVWLDQAGLGEVVDLAARQGTDLFHPGHPHLDWAGSGADRYLVDVAEDGFRTRLIPVTLPSGRAWRMSGWRFELAPVSHPSPLTAWATPTPQVPGRDAGVGL